MASLAGRWKKRSTSHLTLASPLALLSLLLLLLSLLLFLSLSLSLSPSSSPKPFPTQFPECPQTSERLLLYAPHSGFGNQIAELRNAVVVAGILNRTLVVPPVLDHHAVALGSCPKFRVLDGNGIRGAVWDHAVEMIAERRYVSMGDIIDLSSVLSSTVRAIDFRVFLSTWCGLKSDVTCSSWKSLSKDLEQCRSLITGFLGNVRNCVYAVQEDCRTTVWTYNQNDDGTLDPFQPDEELKRKKKISYVRMRRDIYKTFGPGSDAEMASVLSFGSLFSSSYRGSELYIDIHEAPGDPRVASLLQKVEYLPFVQAINNAGKDYASNKIKEPFLCAQLRLLDGQFKNHWKTTFSTLKKKIQSLPLEMKENQANGPLNIFVMTDLPSANWTGSYLAELASDPDSFRLYTLQVGDSFLMQTAEKVRAAGHGLSSRVFPASHDLRRNGQHCDTVLPDISLYLEEAICSCAALGFVGTAGSTIAESIEVMRKNNNCISTGPS